MKAHDRHRRDEGGGHDQLQPHGSNQGDEQMPGRERDGERDGADQHGAGNTGARAVRLDARGQADKSRQREDGQREQQPAKQAERSKGYKYREDDHDGGLRKDKV